MRKPTQPLRLTDGGIVDRARPIAFSFNGKPLHGYAGDTLAAALLANDVRTVSRSFKYHRPRGVFSAGSDEPNALVELRSGARREPNSKATTVELFDGLEAFSQNCWPSPDLDFGAVNQLLSPFLGAGFYYKTFMWPRSFWEKVYEPLIRRAAGLGRLSGEPDPDHYEKAYAFCDVLIIGGGAAGLMAGLAAGRAGARVILCDEDFVTGGSLLSERTEVDGAPAIAWLEKTLAELRSLPEVRLMPRTTVFGVYDGSTYGALERVSDHLDRPGIGQPRQRLWNIHARQTVLAAGASERSIAFGGNDRPGVMLSSSVRTYLNRFGVACGRSTAIFTNNDDGWKTAADLHSAGCAVSAIIDARSAVKPELLARAPRDSNIVLGGRVVGTTGARRLSRIRVLQASGTEVSVPADVLAVSGGWNPNVALTSHLGSRPIWRDDIAAFTAADLLPAGMTVAGGATGSFSIAAALRQGLRAGEEAARRLGFAPSAIEIPATSDEAESYGIKPLWHVKSSKGPAFVDYQNDVTVKDIDIAAQEGFRSVEHLKRYTTLGMATDQGKAGNVNGLAILAEKTGRSITGTGTTTFRPPYTPVAIGAFAGPHRARDFKPTRRAPSHKWAEEQGAVFVETGLWLRAQWFPAHEGEDWQVCVDREVSGTRNRCGFCDVSTLGKIDVQGGDAGAFLDRVYINTFSTLAVGKVRYGAMLREDGFVMDDGTVTRLAENHYYVTTTTANAAKVMQHLEFCHQVLWPDLDVQMTSVTEQWAQYAVAGPRARDLIQLAVDPDYDVSNENFPYMAAMALTVCGGIPARLFRVSFSGELAYELAVPSGFGDSLVRFLSESGRALGAIPYGTEALGVMRIEKGHPAGNELNGQTTAHDVGLAKMLSTKKDFIGRLMAERPNLTAKDRPALIGFKPVDRSARLRAGAHFLALGAPAIATNDEGFMSSVAHSPSLGHWIGLGFIRRGPERLGERVRAYDPVRGADTEVEICAPAFVDPKGEKLRA